MVNLRKKATWLGFLVGFVLVLWSQAAMAGHEGELRVDFVGFGENSDFYAIVYQSEDIGEILYVYQVGAGEPLVVMSLEGTKLKKALKSPEVEAYKISDSGTEGLESTAGSISGAPFGAQFQLTLTGADGTARELGYAPVAADPSGAGYAEVTLKTAYWSADGTKVVVIMNQVLDGEWPMDADTLAAFKL